jgi:hypothetical protein
VVLEEGVEVLVLVDLLVDLEILHQHHHHKEIMVELEPMQILDLLLVVEEEVLVVLELILVLLELLDRWTWSNIFYLRNISNLCRWWWRRSKSRNYWYRRSRRWWKWKS